MNSIVGQFLFLGIIWKIIMKNNRVSILLIISIQLVFLSACSNNSFKQKPDFADSGSIITPTKSLADQNKTLKDKENVPDWCKTQNPDEIESQKIDWNYSDSEEVIKDLSVYANSIEVGIKISRWSSTSLSPDAKWLYSSESDKLPPSVIKVSEKLSTEINPPKNDQLKYLNAYAVWSPGSNALLIEGKRFIDPYLSTGIVIIQMNSSGELISNSYILPNNLERQIYSYWSPDSKQILLAYQKNLSLGDSQPPILEIINLDGTVFKEIQMPEGKYFPYIIWANDGIYFVRYSPLSQIYEVDKIDPEQETSQLKFIQVYSSRYPIALFGVNANANEILIREGESKTSTCLTSLNINNKTRLYSYRFPDESIRIYNGENVIGLGYSLFDKDNTYSEYFYVFDWQKGFIKVNDSFNYPLGWNSIVKGFLFTENDFPNVKIGALVSSPK